MKFTIAIPQGKVTYRYHVRRVHIGPSLERFLVTPFGFTRSILVSSNRPYLLAHGLHQPITWKQEQGHVNAQYFQLLTQMMTAHLKKDKHLMPYKAPTLFEQQFS